MKRFFLFMMICAGIIFAQRAFCPVAETIPAINLPNVAKKEKLISCVATAYGPPLFPLGQKTTSGDPEGY